MAERLGAQRCAPQHHLQATPRRLGMCPTTSHHIQVLPKRVAVGDRVATVVAEQQRGARRGEALRHEQVDEHHQLLDHDVGSGHRPRSVQAHRMPVFVRRQAGVRREEGDGPGTPAVLQKRGREPPGVRHHAVQPWIAAVDKVACLGVRQAASMVEEAGGDTKIKDVERVRQVNVEGDDRPGLAGQEAQRHLGEVSRQHGTDGGRGGIAGEADGAGCHILRRSHGDGGGDVGDGDRDAPDGTGPLHPDRVIEISGGRTVDGDARKTRLRHQVSRHAGCLRYRITPRRFCEQPKAPLPGLAMVCWGTPANWVHSFHWTGPGFARACRRGSSLATTDGDRSAREGGKPLASDASCLLQTRPIEVSLAN